MKIKKLLREMRYEIFKNILLTSFLQTVIAFFIFDIIKSFFDISFVFSYVFAGIYLLVILYRKLKTVNVKTFEKNNPEVREMLSTAADNLDRKNPIIEELFNEVIKKMKKVSSGTLIVPSSILLMVLLIPVLAIIGYEVNPLRVDALSQDKIIETFEGISLIKNILPQRHDVEGELIPDDLLEEDIYGERRIANLGGEEISIKLNRGFETDLTKPKEEDKSQLTFTDYPDDSDIQIEQDSSTFNEELAQESSLARKYNERIRTLR